eukprot:1427229-Rhodomonas_salina.4
MASQVRSAICLRASYAMSGADLAYGTALCLCVSYTMPGTDLACDAICLRVSYAMPGTDLAYSATLSACACPILTWRKWSACCTRSGTDAKSDAAARAPHAHPPRWSEAAA